MGYVLKPELMELPFVDFFKQVEPVVRGILNDYHEAMCDVRRKYQTSFFDLHATTEKAWEFITANHPNDPLLKPYRCGCGALHVGHNSKSKKTVLPNQE